eukprot:11005915-Alexandrium_andersonii.AAC.1
MLAHPRLELKRSSASQEPELGTGSTMLRTVPRAPKMSSFECRPLWSSGLPGEGCFALWACSACCLPPWA